MTGKKDITSLRAAIDYLSEEKEILAIDGEVDPIYEISGIQRSLENGPALLFENIKGYPGVRNVGNLFSRRERIAKMFDAADFKDMTFRCHEAMKRPIPPEVVEKASCQEVVIKKGIDVEATLPIIKHTEKDPARILGGGNTLIGEEFFEGGYHLSFNRMRFRGKDWASIAINPGTHLAGTYIRHRGDPIPLTINIGTPPAVMMVAGTHFLHFIIPHGSDELGFAGALQGHPVKLVKAKTIDAYAIADSEWVIEGFVDRETIVWETEEAEQLGKGGELPFFPEWTGYIGRSYKSHKFQVTAITHRRDRPIFYTPLAYSFELDFLCSSFREACFYELAERIRPGLVTDVNILPGVASWGANVIFQVRKTRPSDEGYQLNILSAALSASPGIGLVIVVDEDVNIYSADDILWAITTRVSPERSIVTGTGGAMGQVMMPAERIDAVGRARHEVGLGIDATVPFKQKDYFERGKYPTDKVDLKKWLSTEEISDALAQQSEYAQILAGRKK
jgi:4-hydroxy-3-polyprenylbenzoate decarboxylase